jgi:hypothetical protein
LSAPADLVSAIDQALKILSWQENLPGDEMPQRWMWHLDWELEAHFQSVRTARDAKYNRSPSEADSEPEALFDENVYSSRFKE